MYCYLVCYKHMNKDGYKSLKCFLSEESAKEEVKTLNNKNRKLGNYFYMEIDLLD